MQFLENVRQHRYIKFETTEHWHSWINIYLGLSILEIREIGIWIGMLVWLRKPEIKKAIGLMKDELSRKIMTEFAGLRTETNNYLTEDSDEDKKAKDTKKCTIKRKLKFEDYEHSSEATQLERKKKKQLGKYKLDVGSLWENHKEFIKNIRLIFKS